MACLNTAVGVLYSAIRPVLNIVILLVDSFKRYSSSVLILKDSLVKWKATTSTVEKTMHVASTSEPMFGAAR